MVKALGRLHNVGWYGSQLVAWVKDVISKILHFKNLQTPKFASEYR